MDQKRRKELLERAWNIKKRFLKMYKTANAGHVGTSLSCAELLTFVVFDWMQGEDEFILSKGHAAAALYSTLAERGFITEKDIETFYCDATYLAAHPPPNKLKGIPFATGSLGHGLSLAAGLALASRYKKSGKRAFCITSDGEIDEGSLWEAASFIIHHSLQNVIWLIDRNHLQGFGRTEEVLKLEPLTKRLTLLGFTAVECNGHDFASLEQGKLLLERSSKPGVLICSTIKGKGWKPYENTVDSHYLPMKDEQYEALIAEIDNQYLRSVSGL
jgi:transketolase